MSYDVYGRQVSAMDVTGRPVTAYVYDGWGEPAAEHDYLPFGSELPRNYGGRTGWWGTVDSLIQ